MGGGGEGEHEDVRVPLKGVLQAGGEAGLVVGARDVEGPLDEDRCLRGHAAQDSGDERPVAGVRGYHHVAAGVGDIRVLLRSPHPGEPGMIRGGVRDQPGVHDADVHAVPVVPGPGDAAAAARVQAGGRDGSCGSRHLDGLGRRAGKRAHVDLVFRLCHPGPERFVETLDQVRYQRRGPRHCQADKPAGDRLALNLARRPLRDVSVTYLVEDLPERGSDALGILLAGEDRVLAVEVLDVVDLVPPVGGGVRRSIPVAVQDQLVLRSHAVIYRHLCSPLR